MTQESLYNFHGVSNVSNTRYSYKSKLTPSRDLSDIASLVCKFIVRESGVRLPFGT